MSKYCCSILLIFLSVLFFSCENETEEVVLSGTNVNDSIILYRNVLEKEPIHNDKNLYAILWNDYLRDSVIDTLVYFDFIKKQIPNFLKFSYPELTKSIRDDYLIFSNDSILLTIKKVPFDSIGKKISYDSYNNLSEINNKHAYGIDKKPVSELNFQLKINDKAVEFPKYLYDDLFDPNPELKYISVCLSLQNEIIVTIRQGGGVYPYIAILLLEPRTNYSDRIVFVYP